MSTNSGSNTAEKQKSSEPSVNDPENTSAPKSEGNQPNPQPHDCDANNWDFGPVLFSGSFSSKKKKADDHLYPAKFDSPEHYARTIAEWAERHMHRPNLRTPQTHKTQHTQRARKGAESPTQTERYIVTKYPDLDIANIENAGIPPGLRDLAIPGNDTDGVDTPEGDGSPISATYETLALAEENFEIELALLQSQLESITWEKQADDPGYKPKVSIVVTEEQDNGSDPGSRKAAIVVPASGEDLGAEQRVLVLRLDVITLSLGAELWSL